jgi:histidinol-phosphate aminotransferase
MAEKTCFLNDNVNPYGPPKSVIDRKISPLGRYSDKENNYFIALLAERHQVLSSQIRIGCGSDYLIRTILKSLLPEVPLIVHSVEYPTFSAEAKLLKAKCHQVPLTSSHQANIDELICLIRKYPKGCVVALSNPTNPTGSYVSRNEIVKFAAFVRQINPNSIILIDEAYIHYAESLDNDIDTKKMIEIGNIVIFRTFSKIYAMPDFRLGYALISRRLLSKIIPSWYTSETVCSFSIFLGEIALRDTAFIKRMSKQNKLRRNKLINQVNDLGYECIKSVSNFICFHTLSSIKLVERLKKNGIIVRECTRFGFPHWVRVSVGSEPCLENFLVAMKKSF